MGAPPSPLYSKGTVLRLKSHRAPEPFGHKFYTHVETPGITKTTCEDRGGCSTERFVFARHPRERYEPSIVKMPRWYQDGKSLRLKIELVLSSSLGYGATTVLCRVHGKAPTIWKAMGHESSPSWVMARIFDPLHYEEYDCVYEADLEYAQEAAAYYQIHKRQHTPAFEDRPDLVPKFYGTWTTTLWRDSKPTKSIIKSKLRSVFRPMTNEDMYGRVKFRADRNPKRLVIHQYRPVRIVLTEAIFGWTMNRLCRKMPCPGLNKREHVEPDKEWFKSQEETLDVFAQVIDKISRLTNLGIIFPCLELKTVMVTEDHKAFIADFSQAVVAPYTDIGWHVQELLKRPNHPGQMHPVRHYKGFSGWFPPEWLSRNGQVSFINWAREKFPAKDYTSYLDFCRLLIDSRWTEILRQYNRLPQLGEKALPPLASTPFESKPGSVCFNPRLFMPDGTVKSIAKIREAYPHLYKEPTIYEISDESPDSAQDSIAQTLEPDSSKSESDDLNPGLAVHEPTQPLFGLGITNIEIF